VSVLDLPVSKSKQIGVKDSQQSKDNSRSYLKAANALSVAKVPQGVQITSSDRGLNIRIKDEALFRTGSADINPEVKEFIDLIAELARDLPNLIAVEGHTDNQPIRTAAFPSNWDLSTARANTLVRYLTEFHQLRSDRFSSTGFAGTRPIESNATLEGQASNRRVELIILRDTSPRVAASHPFLPQGSSFR
jgi:chemotaxis protein MotB